MDLRTITAPIAGRLLNLPPHQVAEYLAARGIMPVTSIRPRWWLSDLRRVRSITEDQLAIAQAMHRPRLEELRRSNARRRLQVEAETLNGTLKAEAGASPRRRQQGQTA